MISVYYATRLLEKGEREMKGCNIKEFHRGAVLLRLEPVNPKMFKTILSRSFESCTANENNKNANHFHKILLINLF